MLVHVGHDNFVSRERIVAVLHPPESAPIKRLINEAREKGMLLDASRGRRVRAAVVMDSGHVVLVAVLPRTVRDRADGTSPPEQC